MKLQGAVLKEQDITFAIVAVKYTVIQSQIESQKAFSTFATYFSGMPIVLMAQDVRGAATYRGRKDIVEFLSKINVAQIPWKEYIFN